jgi:hypothetical protein
LAKKHGVELKNVERSSPKHPHILLDAPLHFSTKLEETRGMKAKMIISDFRKSFSSFFRFLGLNENGSGNQKNENNNGKNNWK